jgi:FkbM family methyltransferase
LNRILRRWAIGSKFLNGFIKFFVKIAPRELMLRNLDKSDLSPIANFLVDGWNAGMLERLIINVDDVVIVLGGYLGDSVAAYRDKFKCRVIAYEPIDEFYNVISQRFETDSKVIIHKNAISGTGGPININLDGDSTSMFSSNLNKVIQLNAIGIVEVLRQAQGSKVAGSNLFIEMNIEGAEFEILEVLFSNYDLSLGVSGLLVQFHPFVDNFEFRRAKIHTQLSNYLEPRFIYPWVWEYWTPKTI